MNLFFLPTKSQLTVLFRFDFFFYLFFALLVSILDVIHVTSEFNFILGMTKGGVMFVGTMQIPTEQNSHVCINT